MAALMLAFVFLQDQPAQAVQQQTPPQPSMLEGPMRIELTSIRERRSASFTEGDTAPVSTDLTLQFRVRGEQLGQIARYGRPIFSQITDSTGKSLVDPSEYSDSEKNYTGRQLALPARLERSGLVFAARVLAPQRNAAEISTMKGTFRVVYATQHESIYIDNPRQYQGRTIDHPRLEEYGIEIFVLPAGQPARAQITANDIALRFVTGEERIHDIVHCDPWLKQLRSRRMAMRDDESRDCIVYKTEAELTDEHTMVIEFYPTIRDVRIPIDFESVKLP